tara:strand:+ start:235 stop:984 length:750 start_codon:yes stop_codon:yes gene_type:complete
MRVFSKFNKIFLFVPYYIIHNNYFFGLIFKFFVKKFRYKDVTVNLNIKGIQTSYYSSFLFKTYEYNDRILIEKNINFKNKCVVVGAGLGFIPILAYKKSKNKLLLFEIDKRISDNLVLNLDQNNIEYELFLKNLSVEGKTIEKNYFYDSGNFLSNSLYANKGKKIFFDQIFNNEIGAFNDYNTLIVDAEGIEEYYIENLHLLKNIKYLFFELHYNFFTEEKINNIFRLLNSNNFVQKDKCFNSYFFIKN